MLGSVNWHIDANNPWHYGSVDTQPGQGINGGLGPSQGPNLVTI